MAVPAGMIKCPNTPEGQVLETMETNPKKVFIEENSPRDGIQNEPVLLSVGERVALIDALSECGFPRIQVGSFVDPRRVPQLAETEKVCESIRRQPGVVYSALLLNEKGMVRALTCGVEHVSIYVSASETHSNKNSSCSVEEATLRAMKMIDLAKSHGVAVRAGVMNAFGCRFEGVISPERVVRILRRYVKIGVDELSLADTSGVAHPRQVEDMAMRVADISDVPVSLHLHDTFGFGLTNAYAAVKAGISRFDASCGGFGGCPFIPGVAGNVATEDLVHLLESEGISTGISLDRVAAVADGLEKKLGSLISGRYVRVWKQNRQADSCSV